jgi:putative sigma-54 modulation protein
MTAVTVNHKDICGVRLAAGLAELSWPSRSEAASLENCPVPSPASPQEAPMQLNVTGHHVEVSTSLKGYVEKKLDRIVRHSDKVIDVHCILTVEKLLHKAEATVLLSGGTVYADATEPNMYAAIDALADKLDRVVKKHKEKLSDHHALEAQKLRPS